MFFNHTSLNTILALALPCLIAGCSEDSSESVIAQSVNAQSANPQPANSELASSSVQATEALSTSTPASTTYRAPLPGASVIPYPVYPNATKYRIGGENGLKIVVFETEDTFDNVDRFFQELAATDLARLQGMENYVRYASEKTDDDPWGTHRPGIVIHHFASTDEAIDYGAAPESRTNIIMSYR